MVKIVNAVAKFTEENEQSKLPTISPTVSKKQQIATLSEKKRKLDQESEHCRNVLNEGNKRLKKN